MAGESSSGSGHTRDEGQGMEVLRAGLLTQETALKALAENVDRRFQVLDGRFDEIADKLDALAIGANRGRNEDRRNQEKMLLKASLSTGLYLRVIVDNLSIVITQKKRRTSCMQIIGLQGWR